MLLLTLSSGALYRQYTIRKSECVASAMTLATSPSTATLVVIGLMSPMYTPNAALIQSTTWGNRSSPVVSPDLIIRRPIYLLFKIKAKYKR